MVLMLNCANLRFGGGLTVGFNIINYFTENFTAHRIIVIAPANCNYERFESANTKVIVLPAACNRAIAKPFVNYMLMPVLSFFHKADCVLSLGNIAFPSKAPQILLVQNAYTVYPESEFWKKMDKHEHRVISSMIKFIKMNLRFADVIFVQTETMRKRIIEQYPAMREKFHVLPSSVSFTSKLEKDGSQQIKPSENGYIKLLCLSKYYVHKNLDIIIEVAKIIRQKKLKITITTTMHEAENKGALNFLNTVKENGLENIIINIGHVNINNVAGVYNEHNGLILPTLLESFSGTYIEAMYFEKPIFTSDMDFAHDVCKDAAFYFNPFYANDIIETVVNAFSNPSLIKQKTRLGKKYVDEGKNWNDAGESITGQINLLLQKQKAVTAISN